LEGLGRARVGIGCRRPHRQLRVTTSYATEPGTGKLAPWFRLTNSGTAAVIFTITSADYRTDGPWTYPVRPGAHANDYFNAVAYNGGWYDFRVTASSDATWSRRCTGHLETGQTSVSG
jgi:phospholipase C